MTLALKSLDTMKISRDNNTTSNADKITHVNAIVSLIPDITHITVDCYMNNFGYQSVAYIKEWFDAIHATGKKVFFRPALAGSFANAAALTTAIVKAASDFSTCWANGDTWDVIPETNPLSSLYVNVAGWNSFVRSTITQLDTTFNSLGKVVDHTFWSQTDQTFIFNSRVEAATLTAMGNKLCVDFYPMDAGTTAVKVANLVSELALAHANYPTADIYITETGYNNTTAPTDADQLEVLQAAFLALHAVPYIKGFNYWVGYGNAAFDKTYIFQSQSLTLPRPAVAALSLFYSDYYTSLAKPTGTLYTNQLNAKTPYDEPTLNFDNALTFYDGVNQSAYINLSKPVGTSYTTVDKPA